VENFQTSVKITGVGQKEGQREEKDKIKRGEFSAVGNSSNSVKKGGKHARVGRIGGKNRIQREKGARKVVEKNGTPHSTIKLGKPLTRKAKKVPCY